MTAPAVRLAGWTSRGWMSFTVANGAVLHLGGATPTAPTAELSVANFLAAGIPQIPAKTRFAEPHEANGHAIAHAVIDIISAGATSPAGRSATDGSTPTTSLGGQVLAPDSFTIPGSRQEIYNFKLFNRSGGNMVVEVKVFE